MVPISGGGSLCAFTMSEIPEKILPISAYMTPEERVKFAEALEAGWRDYLGPERFEAHLKRVKAPAWLADLPRLPPRNPDGSLPDLG